MTTPRLHDEKEDAQYSSLYTFERLKGSGKKSVTPSPDSPFEYKYSSTPAWVFVNGTDYRSYDHPYSGCKIHINVRNPEDVAKAWDVILPIRLKYRDYVKKSKFMVIDDLKKKTQKEISSLDSNYRYDDICVYDSSDGKIYQEENPEKIKTKNRLLATEDRYLKGANILFYFYYFPEEPEQFSKQTIDIFKAMFAEIEKALTEAKIEPAATPDSDFPLPNCKFVSTRVDRDEEDNYFTHAEKSKYYFIDHPVLKCLVAEEELKKQPEKPIQEQQQTSRYKIYKADLLEEMSKILNNDTLAFWQKRTESIPSVYKFITELTELADKKMEIDMITRSKKISDIVNQMRDILKKPNKNLTFTPKCESAESLSDGLFYLLEGTLYGLKYFERIHDDILKYQSSPTIKKSI